MNKEYKIKLDLNKKLYNKKMAFNQFDENVNDFYIEVTKNNELVKDLDKSIVTLVAIKPNNTVDAQFIEVKEGQIYADLKPSMCDLVGNYQAKAMIVLEGEIVTTDTINYSVNEDKIISRLNEDVVSDERFTLFTDALARLSTIESSEEQRIVNEAERILSEENRKIEEAKRVEAELIRQHEEADRTKYDATRESNENIRKQNESIRLANETNRIDEEAKRVEEENKRKLAEEERNANYNFMTEDEERRRSEANAHKEAEVLRVQAETDRVNEEAKRRNTEQGRVSAENTRVSNENTREANEVVRKNNENQRVEAETQRQSRYNSFITEAEANANNFENYTNTAKASEEERKANELDRKSQENRRVSNENERVSSENTRKANEVNRIESEKQRADAENLRKEKIIEIQSDYDSLKKVIIDENASANLQNQINQTNSQLEHKPNKNHVWNMANMGQDVKEAMTGGSVAVVGENTILSENIVDNQVTYKKTDFLELDTSINLFDGIYQPIHITGSTPMNVNNNTSSKTAIVEIKPNTTYSIIKDKASRFNLGTSTEIIEPSKGLSLDGSVLKPMGNSSKLYTIITTGENDKYLYVNVTADNEDIFLQIIEGEQTNLSVNTYPLIFTKNVMAYNKKEIDEQVNKINNKVIDKEHVDFITIDSDLNLYTGLKLKNKRIGGDIGKGIKLEYSSSSDVFIVPIEANKTYSVVVKDTDLIYNEKKYIKIMTCAKLYEPTDFEGTTSIKVEHLEYLQPTNSNICATFTTGENSRYMYLYLFTNNLQEENKVFQVVEGSQTSLTISNMDDCYVFHGVSCYPKHKTYTKEEVDTLLEDIPKNSNTFIKNGEVCEILLNNKVGYKLEHKVTNSINLDTWMLTKGTVNNTTLWSGSDIEAPIKEKGAADFIGGVHGDEVFESASIVCDGNLIDMEKDYNVSFENLSIFVKSTLYRCETSTPVFTRYKKLEFVNGELIISNRLICLVDNFLVERYTGCGLYSVYKDLLLGYTVNTKPELITEGGLGADANMDIGTFFGDGYTVTLKTLSGKTEYFKGYVADFASESRPRYKLYFDCIKSSSGYQLNTDDELNTCFSIKID